MNRTKKNYIPFLAGMATVILLACLISASLAKEDPPAAQTGAQVQTGDARLAASEAGIALFGVERTAPGEKLKADNGAEFPAVVTCTDEKGTVHYYVEAETIADILDVCHKVMYRDTSNCVDFGVEPFLNDRGEQQVKGPNKEPVWFTGDVTCDIDYALKVDSETGEKTGFARGTQFTSGGITASFGRGNNSQAVPLTEEEQKEKEKRDEEFRLSTPLKPEYGLRGGMYTEVDPAEVDFDSWSGTAMKEQKFQSENAEMVEHTFAFTPYLGEYAVITIDNTGDEDIRVLVNRPYTVGNRKFDSFAHVRVPAGQKLERAFRIDGDLPLENRLRVQAITFTDRDIAFTLTAEQYRFGK